MLHRLIDRLFSTRVRVAIAALSLVACAPRPAVHPAAEPHTPEPLRVVREQVDAFNRKDVSWLVARVSPDFKWHTVDEATMVTEIDGPSALRSFMEKYYASLPTVHSTIEEAFVTGTRVALRERVSWESRKGKQSQAALAIYDVRDGKIVEVWYYPAEP